MRLSDKIVASLSIPDTGNRRYPDSDMPGFNARITATGHRSFILRYRLHGAARLYTIGTFPTWTTVAARNRARELRRLIDQGIDPHEHEARARDEAMTVEQFWRKAYEPLHLPTLRPTTQRDRRAMMVRDILPALGKIAVKDVDRADVAELHRQISKRAPVLANRVRTTVSHLMTYAEEPHVIDGERIPRLRDPGSNPARGVRLNHEEGRQRFLTPTEIARLIEILNRRRAPLERSSANLVKFLLLTGARFSEAARATWGQIDFERGTWTKPSHHTKQKKEHVTPLSAPALALLHQIKESSTSEFLFPSPTTGRPLTKIVFFWRSVSKQAGFEGVRVHDLRHSFASVLASGGSSLLLIGQLLGHTQQSTTARYAHLIDAVQRAAVEKAGAVITGKSAAEVIEMPKSRRR